MNTDKNILNTIKVWAFSGTMAFTGFIGYRMVDSLDRLRLEVAGMKVMIANDHEEINRLRDGIRSEIPDTEQTFEQMHMMAILPEKVEVIKPK